MADGQYQYLNASTQAQQYASGGTAPYQKGFLAILFVNLVPNALMLAHFLTHRDWHDDVSEPSTLFGLVINSPPSDEFADNHGKPPHDKQFRSSWKLRGAGDDVYMQKVEKTSGMDDAGLESRRRFRKAHQGVDILMGPIKKVGENFSGRLSN